jgi:biopolymer transport protein ExbB
MREKMMNAMLKRLAPIIGTVMTVPLAMAQTPSNEIANEGVPLRSAPVNGTLAADLSPWVMFTNADPVVKSVIIILLLASVLTWTVWLAKTLELASAKRRARAGLAALSGARNLAEAMTRLSAEAGPVTAMAREALEEQELSQGAEDELLDRIRLCLGRIEVAERRAAQRHIGILATIGATAPFIGLFGTVWGIMNSFVGIARTQTTNLAVVAPGIAEALLATAAGLIAAIPAVVIYNYFTRSTASYRALLGDASTELLRLASRDRDRRPAALAKAAE